MPGPKVTKRKSARKRQTGGGTGGSGIVALVANQSELSQIVEPSMPLFPPKIVKMLRYASGHIGLTCTSGAVAFNVFRANDVYDPDYTGTGHQPMGLDQMLVFYWHFCVLSCKVTAKFSTASGSQGTVCVRYDGTSSALSDIEQIMEVGGNVTTSMESIGNFGASKTLELKLDMPKVQGLSRETILADANLRGSAAASPSEISYVHVGAWNAAGVTYQVNVYVVLEYEVAFLEPKSATSSLDTSSSTDWKLQRLLRRPSQVTESKTNSVPMKR